VGLLALVMAGGKGSRMGWVEKPVLVVRGRKLIDFAIKEIKNAKVDAIYITSPHTPETEKYLYELGMEVFRGKGKGYMDDLFLAVKELEIADPVMSINSDLYIAKSGIVSEFINAYMRSPMPSMSCVYRNGRHVGINIFDPVLGEQSEEKFIIDERDIINIDTPEDLRRAENG